MERLPCACFRKAACFRDAFNDLFVQAIIKWCDADNLQFDCDVYPPSPQRTAACDRANTARSRSIRLLIDFMKKIFECSLMK
jgi:hypothetical protein